MNAKITGLALVTTFSMSVVFLIFMFIPSYSYPFPRLLSDDLFVQGIASKSGLTAKAISAYNDTLAQVISGNPNKTKSHIPSDNIFEGSNQAVRSASYPTLQQFKNSTPDTEKQKSAINTVPTTISDSLTVISVLIATAAFVTSFLDKPTNDREKREYKIMVLSIIVPTLWLIGYGLYSAILSNNYDYILILAVLVIPTIIPPYIILKKK